MRPEDGDWGEKNAGIGSRIEETRYFEAEKTDHFFHISQSNGIQFDDVRVETLG